MKRNRYQGMTIIMRKKGQNDGIYEEKTKTQIIKKKSK